MVGEAEIVGRKDNFFLFGFQKSTFFSFGVFNGGLDLFSKGVNEEIYLFSVLARNQLE
jgi:hypothetical protein